MGEKGRYQYARTPSSPARVISLSLSLCLFLGITRGVNKGATGPGRSYGTSTPLVGVLARIMQVLVAEPVYVENDWWILYHALGSVYPVVCLTPRPVHHPSDNQRSGWRPSTRYECHRLARTISLPRRAHKCNPCCYQWPPLEGDQPPDMCRCTGWGGSCRSMDGELVNVMSHARHRDSSRIVAS